MSALSSRHGRKLSLVEQMMELKRRFMQLYNAFKAMAEATDEEMQARPTKTEVALMIGNAIEQAMGQRVVHAEADAAPAPVGAVARTLSLVPPDESDA